jgi:hypothetical protein
MPEPEMLRLFKNMLSSILSVKYKDFYIQTIISGKIDSHIMNSVIKSQTN